MRRLAMTIGKILLSPLSLLMSIRRSMTGASVTLLLIGIISLNIVWGYPWTGMFAASATMLTAGFIINRLMRPKLMISYSLPNSAPVDQSFLVTMHLRNHSPFPAMDLSTEMTRVKRRRVAWSSKGGPDTIRSLDSRQTLPTIRPDGRCDVPITMVGGRRGVHVLPDVRVFSMFPFHLFRSQRQIKSTTQIAITPRLMTADDDPLAKAMLDTLGGWSYRLLAGDALDYTGSREYQVGMPVRRWDFPSWARLGRPIVREFQSPSIQSVTLIVDTGGAVDEDPAFERLLSLAATAVNGLCRNQIRVRMYLTSEPIDTFSHHWHSQSLIESEPLLIQLASAVPVDVSVASTRVDQALDQVGQSPTLLLSMRSTHAATEHFDTNVTRIRVDTPQPDVVAKPHRRMPIHV